MGTKKCYTGGDNITFSIMIQVEQLEHTPSMQI